MENRIEVWKASASFFGVGCFLGTYRTYPHDILIMSSECLRFVQIRRILFRKTLLILCWKREGEIAIMNSVADPRESSLAAFGK